MLVSNLPTYLIGLNGTDSSEDICGADRSGCIPDAFSNENFVTDDYDDTDQTQEEDFNDDWIWEV